jgi:hypothetical protein
MRKHVDATKSPLQARSRSGCSFQCQTFEEGGVLREVERGGFGKC